jgi:hypothetical protein
LRLEDNLSGFTVASIAHSLAAALASL